MMKKKEEKIPIAAMLLLNLWLADRWGEGGEGRY
jgi:hypothetical protein